MPTMPELRAFLARHGLRQEDLADGIGISRVSISSFINGATSPRKTTLDAILGFCRQYDPSVTYEQLFADAPERASA